MVLASATITIDAADELEELLSKSVEEQWGDGLPLIPPTRGRVEHALRSLDLDPASIVGVVAPSNAGATVRDVVVNAIMAGCTPAMMPLVLAATEAMCQPTFGLLAKQVTTHPVGLATFVSGPLANGYGVNAGTNVFGPGNRTNAAVGRAIRLVMLNIGGGIPGVADQATFGNPGKYTWFFGENQEQSPFPSFAERHGAGDRTMVVTAGAGGFQNMLETTTSAPELIRVFARSMALPTHNDLLLCGAPLLALSPEHARVLADAGMTIRDVQEELWKAARLKVKHFSDSAQKYRLPPNWEQKLGGLSEDTEIPMCESPDFFHIVVSGGAGRHSVYIPGFGAAGTAYLGGNGLSMAEVDRYEATAH